MLDKISRLMLQKYIDANVPYIYNRGADFDWIIHESGLPWLNLDIKVPFQMIAHEIESIQHLIVEHRYGNQSHKGWKSFCIHGKSYDATREQDFYQDDRPYVWTQEAKSLMPLTVEYFRDSWPHAGFARLRVMFLAPRGYITIHRDGTRRVLAPINIAITQPEGCNFVFEKFGTVPFYPGGAFLLDVSNRHVVFNDSDLPRWHLILDQGFDNQKFKDLVVQSYQKVYHKQDENDKNNSP